LALAWVRQVPALAAFPTSRCEVPNPVKNSASSVAFGAAKENATSAEWLSLEFKANRYRKTVIRETNNRGVSRWLYVTNRRRDHFGGQLSRNWRRFREFRSFVVHPGFLIPVVAESAMPWHCHSLT
jgi:hypothetical protein